MPAETPVSTPSPVPAPATDLLPKSFLNRLARMSIVATKLYPGSRMGQRISKAKGAGMEFSEHKPYSPGDDFRAIDWNVYARTDHFHLKTFETEENLYVYVIVDVSASMGIGSSSPKLLHARQLAAAFSYVALVHGDNLGIHAMNDGLRDSLSTSSRRLRPSDVLEFCAGLRPAGRTDLLHALQAFSIHTGRPGMVFLISDFFSETDLASALRYLVYNGFGVLAFHLIDPAEENPQLSGELDLEDSETGELLPLTVRSGTVEQVRQSFARHCHEVHRALAIYEARYFRLRTDRPVEKFVLEDLRQAGVVE
ncbi:MAG: DUF58 domain-containing protein [Planctomycetes bacterium]|nr:DUF58 domain-containing protein [Planctomycetota bacterium]